MLLRLFLGAIVVGLSLGLWSVFIEPAWIRFKDHAIPVAGWPAELSGYTIAFITDAHVGSPFITLKRLQSIVESVNALEPDLVLLGGDYVIQEVVGGRPVPSKDIAAVLSKLKAKHGVFGVLGNHDWWDDAPRIRQEFVEQQVRILEDAAQHIDVDGKGFWLVGVSDYTEGDHDVDKALSAVGGSDPIIVLTHSPDIFPDVPPRVGLTIAGHTHGGQVYVPLVGRPIVPSKYGQRYAIGLIEENGKRLFVGPGIGTSILPIRFLTPPEISILRLHPDGATAVATGLPRTPGGGCSRAPKRGARARFHQTDRRM